MNPIIFFDGVCGLCNGVVLFVLQKDKHKRFHFSPLQSPFALEELPKHGGDPQSLNTFYVLKDSGELLSKSTAALYVLSQLGGIYRILSLGRFFPRFFRDFCYDLIAQNRYRFFGKKEVCMLPEEDWMERFIEEHPAQKEQN